MENINLAIMTADMNYANALADAIVRNSSGISCDIIDARESAEFAKIHDPSIAWESAEEGPEYVGTRDSSAAHGSAEEGPQSVGMCDSFAAHGSAEGAPESVGMCDSSSAHGSAEGAAESADTCDSSAALESMKDEMAHVAAGEWSGENDILISDIPNIEGPNTMRLVEKEYAAAPESGTLYKYGNVKCMVDDICLFYSQVSGHPLVRQMNSACGIYAFLSPAGGTGCTSCAIGFCREMSRYRRKRVLYLPLTDLSDMELYVRSGEKKNIKRYLYYMLDESHNEHTAIEAFLAKDDYGVMFFEPTGFAGALQNLSEEEFLEFLDSLTKSCMFDAIVFDAGNDMDEKAESVLLAASGAAVIIDGRRTPKASIDRVAQKLALMSAPNAVTVLNRRIYPEDADEGIPLPEGVIAVDDDPSSFRISGELVDISLDGAFGRGIRDVADVLTNTLGKSRRMSARS